MLVTVITLAAYPVGTACAPTVVECTVIWHDTFYPLKELHEGRRFRL